ncbi:MAG: four helix bundle protein [Ignavibacteriales bacterium]|nr:four helix bundle protein [Ignavibacteriales bacterium]
MNQETEYHSLDFDGAKVHEAGESTYSFEALEVYQKARKFRKSIYSLAKKLPPEEKHNLVPQMLDCARSMTNNIAEGHGRFHFQETMQFFRVARGSAQELLDDLNICLDEGYFDADFLNQLKKDGFQVVRSINGYIAYLRKRKQEASS